MNTWDELRTATPAQVLAWARETPWAEAMASCPQDAQWQAEGDVWTHTTLVVCELERLPEWSDLGVDDRCRLMMTALFHDAGKPATSHVDPESGRIRSPKHSLVGEKLARQVLGDLGCELALREEIARLVRYHGRPPYLFEKPDSNLEVISLSWQVDTRLHYLFALADTRGRVAADTARPEDVLHLWKLGRRGERLLRAALRVRQRSCSVSLLPQGAFEPALRSAGELSLPRDSDGRAARRGQRYMARPSSAGVAGRVARRGSSGS
jgi:hypothetical protein